MTLFFLAFLVSPRLVLAESDSRGVQRRDQSSFIFAATRGLRDLDIHPALKVPLLPGAIIIDIAFLPLEVLADLVS